MRPAADGGLTVQWLAPMSNGLITLYSMDRPRLWGRDEFATELFAEFRAGCTIFGIEGVTGAGKSEFLFQFSRQVQDDRGPDAITVRGGDAPTEALLIASLYKALTEAPRSNEQHVEQAAERFMAQLPKAARLLAGAFIKDVAKVANLENTVKQFADLVAGKDATADPYTSLLDLERDNQRMLFTKALTFVTDLGNPMCFIIDDYELLDASAESFLRALLRNKPDSCVLFLASNTEKPSTSNWQKVMKPSILAEQGSVRFLPELDEDALAAWYEAETHVKPDKSQLGELIESSSGGRPKYVELILRSASGQHSPPRVLNVAEVVRSMRAELGGGARLIGELMALLPGAASVPRDLIGSAVRARGFEFGSALDEIVASNLIGHAEGRVSFLHSSYAAEWLGDIDQQRRDDLCDLWYGAFVAVGYISPDYVTSGLVPLLAERIVDRQSAEEVGQLAEALRSLGATEDGLLLLDLSWNGDADGTRGDT